MDHKTRQVAEQALALVDQIRGELESVREALAYLVADLPPPNPKRCPRCSSAWTTSAWPPNASTWPGNCFDRWHFDNFPRSITAAT